ncbi:synaptic vesicle glycoprotein 2A isoform X2 [Lepeophtheirus salmonis]|uniref:synaptic vesicle glycoprotein 2A isoform X2 n=1 Tax=Lepeophtheirus salmonis TaxID=72036 RepID=UPI001AE29137|nr:synaptic vesicle glycoprotein 2C-like isoform X2 [Lepeophtheirus salmonis]
MLGRINIWDASRDKLDSRYKLIDYEAGISVCKYGYFHWKLLAICGLANASDAIELLCVAFLLPSAQCDLKLTSTDKGWLSALMFIGMLVGGYIWGSLGDSHGRKSMLMNSMGVNAIFGFFSSLAQEKYSFFLLRFLSGVGVGGSIPLVWSYFAEFQPKDRRGSMLSMLANFWMVGNVAVAGLAWIIVPQEIGFHFENFTFNSWRIFTLCCGVPSLIASICLTFFPESPKYLIAKGKNEEALRILANIYSENTGKPASDFPASGIEDYFSPDHSSNESLSIFETIKIMYINVMGLFSKSYCKVTVVMLFICFSIQFGYYGLWLWFPELFSKLNRYYTDHPNSTAYVCEITNYVPLSTSAEDSFCSGTNVPSSVFIESFIVSTSALPGNLWTIFMIDRLGRKFFLILSMVLSGLSAFLIYFVSSSLWNLVVSCIFGAVSTMGFTALDCLSIELFPTHLRGTAMALTLAIARLGAILGNIIFGYFVETSCEIPILSVSILLILGGLSSLLLPNTTRTSIA